MTLNQATTLLAGQLGKELDLPFKLMLAERIRIWRSRLLKNTLDKDQRERKFFRQIVYIPMVKTKEVPCITSFEGCDVAVSAHPVPKPLRANGILFDYLGGINGMNPFQESTMGMIQIMAQGKYSKCNTRFTWSEPTIMVHGNPELPMIRIEGVFDNPEDAAKLNCSCGIIDDCDFWNREYPCSGDIMQLIVQSIVTIDYQRAITPVSGEITVDGNKGGNMAK